MNANHLARRNAIMRSMRRLAPTLLVIAALGIAAAPAGATLTAHLREGTEPEALAVGPEGDLWYAGTNRAGEPRTVVGKIAAGGAVSEYVVPNSAAAPGVGGLTRGPEGLMWFTRPGADRIERMGATGNFEGFAVPTPGSRPTGIVAAPGGFLWVTMEGTGRIAQVDPAGSVRETALAADSRPTALAFGSDSALWAIEAEAATLLRASLAGTPSAFPLPSSGAVFEGTIDSDITAGPDGALWLSQIDGPWIGRLGLGSGSPQYVRYPVPVESGTTLVSPGPHFDVWFTDEGGEIGSISSSGQVGEPACAVKNCVADVQALAEGPEGALWFAAGDTIGTFTPPRLSVATVLDGPVRVSAGGRATMKVRCSGGAAGQKCSGRVEILPAGHRKHAQPLARGRYSGIAQTTTKVTLHLTPAARRLLDAKGKVRVRPVLFIGRIEAGKPIEQCPAKGGGQAGCATLLPAATP